MKKGILLIGILLMSFTLVGCKLVLDMGGDKPGEAGNDNSDKSLSGTTIDSTSAQNIVKKGDTIKVDYAGWKEDGTYFDTSIEDVAKEHNLYNPQRPYEPLKFAVGAGQMIICFDKGVLGMKVGETKTIECSPEEAYGEADPAKVQNLELGKDLFLFGQNMKVTGVSGDVATIDFNLPVAGKQTTFDVTVVSTDSTGGVVSATGTAKIDYTISYDGGRIFDSSNEETAKTSDNYDAQRNYEPIDYKIGAGLKGLDEGLLGMKVGETKQLNLNPEDSFGKYDTGYVFDFAKGDTISYMPLTPRIVAVSQTGVVLDFNHPLAGQKLFFEVTLKEIVVGTGSN